MAVGHQLLLVVHVLAAMTWFGAGLPLVRRLRRALAQDRAAAEDAAREVVRGATMALVFGLVTAASGIAMILSAGGFAVYAPRIHAGLGLSVLALLLGVAARAVWSRALTTVASGATPASASPLARRAAMLHGMTHLLLVVTLVLMLWRS